MNAKKILMFAIAVTAVIAVVFRVGAVRSVVIGS